MSGKRTRHSPKQIVEKLQEADRLLNAGQSLGQVLQALSVSQATFHRWRQRYGGMILPSPDWPHVITWAQPSAGLELHFKPRFPTDRLT